jgi:hypothetical protein
MEQDKQKLIDSFLAEKAASIANAKKSIKNSEIAKAIKHNKTIDNISLKKLKLILELLTDMEELQETVLIVQLSFFQFSVLQQVLAYQE